MSTDSVYDPIPSLGHELGIIFGFAGLMLVSMVVYTVFWKVYQKKVKRVEEERRAKLSDTQLYMGLEEKSRRTWSS